MCLEALSLSVIFGSEEDMLIDIYIWVGRFCLTEKEIKREHCYINKVHKYEGIVPIYEQSSLHLYFDCR